MKYVYNLIELNGDIVHFIFIRKDSNHKHTKLIGVLSILCYMPYSMEWVDLWKPQKRFDQRQPC